MSSGSGGGGSAAPPAAGSNTTGLKSARLAGGWLVLVALAACGGQSQTQGDGGAGQYGGSVAASAGAGQQGGSVGTSAGGVAGIGAAGGAGPIGSGGGAGESGASPAVELIDDVDQTGDMAPALPPGSSGFWWGRNWLGNWFVDAPAPDPISRDATAAEIVPPRGSSAKAYRVHGSGRSRGVDLWAQLDHPGGRSKDLSAYAGITFWAKLAGGDGRIVVGMNPGVSYFDAPDDVPSLVVSVPEGWERLELRFETFGVDGRAVASIDFVVGEGGEDFDFWIDDLAFLCRGECPAYD